MSAQIALVGLFPPHEHQIWNKNCNWHPIPIHTVPRRQDALTSPLKPCERYKRAMIEYENSTEFKTLLDSKRTLIKYLEENSGAKLNTIADIHNLYDTLYIEKLTKKRYVVKKL